MRGEVNNFGSWDTGRVVTHLVKKAEPSVSAVAFHLPHLASREQTSANGCVDIDGFQASGQHDLRREPKLCMG